jgi:hypothetical protein
MTYYRKKEKAIIEKEQILSVEIAVKEEQGDTLKDEV